MTPVAVRFLGFHRHGIDDKRPITRGERGLKQGLWFPEIEDDGLGIGGGDLIFVVSDEAAEHTNWTEREGELAIVTCEDRR